MRTMTLAEIDAIGRSEFGRATGLIRRLADTARHALLAVDTAKDELRRWKENEAERDVIRPDAERTLVVARRCGTIEVYGQAWNAVRIGYMPEVPVRVEQSAEEYMLSSLPKAHQELYMPSGPSLRAIGDCRACLTPEKARLLRYELESLDYLNQLQSAIEIEQTEIPA